MSDLVKRLRDARNWFNNDGQCCGQVDSVGTCAAPACIFDEALKEFYRAADLIEKLSEDLLHSQTRETEYEEGFTEGLHVGTKNARELVVAVRDLMKTISGLVNNGTLELKSDKEAGQFLAHALNRVEEAIEVVDQQ